MHTRPRRNECQFNFRFQLQRGRRVKILPLFSWSLALAFGSCCLACGGMKVKKSTSTARVSLYMALCGGCTQRAAASVCWTILLSTPLLRWEVKLLRCFAIIALLNQLSLPQSNQVIVQRRQRGSNTICSFVKFKSIVKKRNSKVIGLMNNWLFILIGYIVQTNAS